jgi:hypothetical protein
MKGLNYTKTFSPVAKLVTLKCFLIVLAIKSQQINENIVITVIRS